jgi:hypothetical protein
VRFFQSEVLWAQAFLLLDLSQGLGIDHLGQALVKPEARHTSSLRVPFREGFKQERKTNHHQSQTGGNCYTCNDKEQSSSVTRRSPEGRA